MDDPRANVPALPNLVSPTALLPVDVGRSRWRRFALSAKFWPNVGPPNKDGCWPWLGARCRYGYGRVWIGHRGQAWGLPQRAGAHRLAWVLFRGEAPPALCVCHSCDNPSCVNPFHLWLGTQADNMQDCSRKGRLVAIPPHSGKLSWESVEAIRAEYRSGTTTRALATKYGINKSTAWEIVANHIWKAS